MEEHYRMSGYITVTTDVPESPAAIKAFDRPKEIGCFSLDSSCKKLPNSTQMKKFYLNRTLEEIIGQLDLSDGFEEDNFEIRTFPEDKIDNVLDWIKEKKFKHLKSEQGKPVDFVCSRGAIGKLLCTPFSSDSWRIHASKFQGTIYFSSVDTEAKDLRNKEKISTIKRKSYCGLKFEQYMTANEPNGEPDLTQRCDEQGMFCVVFRNRIGDHTLLFRAEMDAVTQELDKSQKYVELKTLDKDVHDYHIYKSLSMWAQSIVTGVEDIICAITDDKGLVKNRKVYKTQKLHEGQKPYTCKVVGCEKKYTEPRSFLSHVERHLTDDELKKVYKRKPYQCRIFMCQETRNDFNSVRRHIRKDHHLNEQEVESLKEKEWSPPVCIHFLNKVLNWLKYHLEDDPKKVYELNYNGGGEKIHVSEVRVIGESYVEKFRKEMQDTPVESEDPSSDRAGPSTPITRTRSGSFRGAKGTQKKIKRK